MAMRLHGKRVFLSGPMTGWRDNNAAGFAVAHARARAHGAARIYDPAAEWLAQPLGLDAERRHEDYMRACIHELTSPRYDADRHGATRPLYDALVSLPGWETSDGATRERELAEYLGIEVIDLYELGDAS